MTTITEPRPHGRAVGRDIVEHLQRDDHGLPLSWLCIRYAVFEPRVLAIMNECWRTANWPTQIL